MRTQARSDCGHCSTGPSTVVDQSTARMRAPMSPPPANTDSINCVLLRSMVASLTRHPHVRPAPPIAAAATLGMAHSRSDRPSYLGIGRLCVSACRGLPSEI
jgi:hypothetical protein